MTGIELIAQERREQIEKHGYTADSDAHFGAMNQLGTAAALLAYEPLDSYEAKIQRIIAIEDKRPEGWNPEIWDKMNRKPYLQRLIIAGALIAAEIDRLQAQQTNSK